jgi:hypothetical protein
MRRFPGTSPSVRFFLSLLSSLYNNADLPILLQLLLSRHRTTSTSIARRRNRKSAISKPSASRRSWLSILPRILPPTAQPSPAPTLARTTRRGRCSSVPTSPPIMPSSTRSRLLKRRPPAPACSLARTTSPPSSASFMLPLNRKHRRRSPSHSRRSPTLSTTKRRLLNTTLITVTTPLLPPLNTYTTLLRSSTTRQEVTHKALCVYFSPFPFSPLLTFLPSRSGNPPVLPPTLLSPATPPPPPFAAHTTATFPLLPHRTTRPTFADRVRSPAAGSTRTRVGDRRVGSSTSRGGAIGESCARLGMICSEKRREGKGAFSFSLSRCVLSSSSIVS